MLILFLQFAPPVSVPTGDAAAPQSVIAADFDGDGVVEVICVESDPAPERIELFENNGSLISVGTVSAPAGSSYHWQGVAGDIDGDGDLDLVVSSAGIWGPGGDGISVYLNTSPAGGPISFVAEGFYPTANTDPGHLALADFNGDGRLDVAAASWDQWTPETDVSIHLNAGAPPFFAAPTALTVGAFPAAVAAADMDADGDADLVVCRYGLAGGVFVFENGALPGVAWPNSAGFGHPSHMVVRDLDGGAPDVACIVYQDPVTCVLMADVFLNAGALSFVNPAGAIGPGDFGTSLSAAIDAFDINQDGARDLLFTAPAAYKMRYCLGDGAGGFLVTGAVPGPSPSAFMMDVEHADLNGDGVPDAIVVNNEGFTPAMELGVYLNTAPPFAAPPSLTIPCPLADGTVGSPYVQALSGMAGTPPYAFSVVGGLPPGLKLAGSTLEGTPAVPGVYSFSIVLTDSEGIVDAASCSLTVSNPGVPPPPGAAGGGGGGGGGGCSAGTASSGRMAPLVLLVVWFISTRKLPGTFREASGYNLGPRGLGPGAMSGVAGARPRRGPAG